MTHPLFNEVPRSYLITSSDSHSPRLSASLVLHLCTASPFLIRSFRSCNTPTAARVYRGASHL